ncbi:MAG: hypothetical protein ACU0DK_14645 [Pseudooceanicola sp.]
MPTIPLSRFLAFVFMLLSFAAAPGRADDYRPMIFDGGLSGCSAIPGISVFRYNTFSGPDRRTRYVFSDTCYSPEGRWFAAPESLEGFEPTQGPPGVFGRFEMVQDGERRHQRRWLSAAPLDWLMGMEDRPAGDDLFETNVRIPEEFTALFDGPGLVEATSRGFSFRKPRPDVAALPAGLWLVEGSAANWHRLDDDPAVKSSGALIGSFAMLLESTPDGLRLVGTSPVHGREAFDLVVAAGGEVSGILRYTVENMRNLSVREPDEFATAEVQVDRISGRMVEDRGTLRAIGLGVGRVVLRNGTAEAAEDAWLSFVASPVPEYVDEAMILSVFPDYRQVD